MRNYIPHYARYGLSAARYQELRAYCLQYPLWQAEAKSLLGVGAQRYSSMPHGSGVGDPVARAAERREVLTTKIQLVERLARAVEDGRWYTAIIQNVCMGRSLSVIDQTILPTANRNAYYRARRAFFLALDEIKS